MRKLLALGLALAFGGAQAQAATTTLSIIINSPPSTVIACPLAPSYSAPLPAASVICTIAVTPAGWSGALTLSGPDAASFALSGSNLVVGSAALAAGTYSVTITATP